MNLFVRQTELLGDHSTDFESDRPISPRRTSGDELVVADRRPPLVERPSPSCVQHHADRKKDAQTENDKNPNHATPPNPDRTTNTTDESRNR